jgi:hypothetical protein
MSQLITEMIRHGLRCTAIFPRNVQIIGIHADTKIIANTHLTQSPKEE